jgi:hypothetical protein
MPMTPSEIVSRILRSLAIPDVMSDLAEIARYDRYQASAGIENAASYLFSRAQSVGLQDVVLKRFEATGDAKWWSWRAPTAWTPIVARLECLIGSRSILSIDHQDQPFLIATHSMPTEGCVAPLINLRTAEPHRLKGAVVVVDSEQLSRSGFQDSLEASGCLGFITDAPSRTDCNGDFSGRVELRQKSSIFGFSVTPQQLSLVTLCAEAGGNARATIQIDRSACMPLVSGLLPGDATKKEIWLIAHLCHPRPGANDNASGVAALLGTAKAIAEFRQYHPPLCGRPIRFLWGPEFLGSVAAIHERVNQSGSQALPFAVLNLDMVGEDQNVCGSPFVVERSPDHCSSLITPIAECLVGEVFAATAKDGGTWNPKPFAGFSDHAVFADPNVACPAIQFCHTDDPFNHSGADALDKVSSIEMARSITAAAASACILSDDSILSRLSVNQIVESWCEAEALESLKVADLYRSFDEGRWADGLIRYVKRRNLKMLGSTGEKPSPCGQNQEPDGEPRIKGCWAGPFNMREMIADISEPGRAQIETVLRRDKFNAAVLFQLAMHADGSRSWRQMADVASFCLRRPIPSQLVSQLADALLKSGWVREL